jgi:transposase
VPTPETEALRSDISLKRFLTGERTAVINRLHSIYGHEGIINVTKKDLKTRENREKRFVELPLELQDYAGMLCEQLNLFETQLEKISGVITEKVQNNDLAPYIMSIPGMAIGQAANFIAYIGDGNRFTKAGQVANYAGLTPRVDCSGMTNHYGSIAKYQYCKPIRGTIVESVFSLTRSSNGGELSEKYQRLSKRLGKVKSAIAVARKMVIVGWLLMKRKETYRGITVEYFKKKMKYYGIKAEKWEALLPKITEQASQFLSASELAKAAA